MTPHLEKQLRDLEEAEELMHQYRERFGSLKINYRFDPTQFVDIFKKALETGVPFDFETGKLIA